MRDPEGDLSMITAFIFRALDRNTYIVLGLLLAVGILLPLLSLTDPSFPLHVPTYAIALIGKYLCYALLALSVDLVWGYCGILSLGHAAFFALGGYAMGMYLMRQIGARGVYANPILPDFMVFLNWTELPWFWYGFDHFWFAMIMVSRCRAYSPSSSAGSPSARASPASISRSSRRR
jgi:urea transport system permease protein